MNYDNGRVRISFDPNGQFNSIMFKTFGLNHFFGAPAYYLFDYFGKLYIKKYYFFGLLHRMFGPAVVEYNDDGETIGYESHYFMNLYHNFWGPAIKFYDLDGNLKKCKYYIFGIYLYERSAN